METLKIRGTEDTPKVEFDPDREIFEISGRALPEDVNSFFTPVFDWLKQYFEAPLEKTVFIFNLSYFNTASAKILDEFFAFLEEAYNNNVNIEVKWLCLESDEDIIEAGEEFSENVGLPFEIELIPE